MCMGKKRKPTPLKHVPSASQTSVRQCSIKDKPRITEQTEPTKKSSTDAKKDHLAAKNTDQQQKEKATNIGSIQPKSQQQRSEPKKGSSEDSTKRKSKGFSLIRLFRPTNKSKMSPSMTQLEEDEGDKTGTKSGHHNSRSEEVNLKRVIEERKKKQKKMGAKPRPIKKPPPKASPSVKAPPFVCITAAATTTAGTAPSAPQPENSQGCLTGDNHDDDDDRTLEEDTVYGTPHVMVDYGDWPPRIRLPTPKGSLCED